MKDIKPLYFASGFVILMYAIFYVGSTPLVFFVLFVLLGISQLVLALDTFPTNRFVNLFEIMATILIFSLFSEMELGSFKTLSEVRWSLIPLFLTPVVFLLELIIKNFKPLYLLWSAYFLIIVPITFYLINLKNDQSRHNYYIEDIIAAVLLGIINLLFALNIFRTNATIAISQILIAVGIILIYTGNWLDVVFTIPLFFIGIVLLCFGILQKKS